MLNLSTQYLWFPSLLPSLLHFSKQTWHDILGFQALLVARSCAQWFNQECIYAHTRKLPLRVIPLVIRGSHRQAQRKCIRPHFQTSTCKSAQAYLRNWPLKTCSSLKEFCFFTIFPFITLSLVLFLVTLWKSFATDTNQGYTQVQWGAFRVTAPPLPGDVEQTQHHSNGRGGGKVGRKYHLLGILRLKAGRKMAIEIKL